ncbi:MAG: hypothetical protein N2313_08970 [Meiothermus ruber]|uniref:hypothetical protein n=1 Tax=Meiothermus ruber TaxID=277 RepID=UPI0023F9ECF2|nr:hypothetical protein [Meiothermus ruber]MCX7803138.1 hypothetical protein [Meiothermus ruber]
MAGIALLELMLLLLAVGLLAWVFGASRNLPPAQEEQAHRLEAALAEIGRLGGGCPTCTMRSNRPSSMGETCVSCCRNWPSSSAF